jgi:predicted kinase
MRILVTGVPGSGKTTLAAELGRRVGLRHLSKDAIKEALWDHIGPGDLAWSQALGAAAVDALRALARSTDDVVIDTPVPAAHADEWRAVDGLVEVHCACPTDLARARYVERRRHPCHFDHERVASYDDWVADDAARPPVGPRVEVDTTNPVDIDAVIASVRAATRE